LIKTLWTQLNAAQAEINTLRDDREDLLLVKSILARKVLNNQCDETDEMFGFENGSKTYARGGQASKESGTRWIELRREARYQQVADNPAVLVRGERLEFNGVTIRCGRALGRGGNGSVIAAEVIAQPDESIPSDLAIKAMPKNVGLEHIRREAMSLKVLGQAGIVPQLIAVLETSEKFLLIMVSHHLERRISCLPILGETRNGPLGPMYGAR
jgi:hypothetical protein